MQLGVRNDEAAARAEAKGVTVIMNRCPKIEYGRLSGEIGWNGINSRILSSKRPSWRQGRPEAHVGLARREPVRGAALRLAAAERGHGEAPPFADSLPADRTCSLDDRRRS